MIVPHRNPVFNAKALATIDARLSGGGRVTVGVGARLDGRGIQGTEDGGLQAPRRRHRRIHRHLQEARTGAPVAYKGRFYDFDEVVRDPQADPAGGPPIWIGGHIAPALRRVARLGDGWHPVGATAASPLPPEEMRAKLGEDPAPDDGGRPRLLQLQVSYKAPIYDGGKPRPGAQRRLFTGGADAILEDIWVFRGPRRARAGFYFRTATLSECLARMQQFGAEIIART